MFLHACVKLYFTIYITSRLYLFNLNMDDSKKIFFLLLLNIFCANKHMKAGYFLLLIGIDGTMSVCNNFIYFNPPCIWTFSFPP